ncbi:MAG: hypothetical protein KDE56_02045 [Anaerolineales bacterium]|nr:hypothetical protein [Anaerolineales bacterium]
MQDNSKKRLQNISYIVLALVAIILILIVLGVKRNLLDGDTWEAIALNIATEVLGVFIVFFLLNKLLIGDEMSLAQRIAVFMDRLDKQEQHPPAASYLMTAPELGARLGGLLQEATRIDLIGVVLAGAIKNNLNIIYDSVRAGKHYRVVVVDPESVGLANSVARSRIKDKPYYLEAIGGVVADMVRLQRAIEVENLSGSVQVRLLQHSPPFGLKAFDSNKPNGRIYVEIYANQAAHSPVIELEAERDGEWYQYFLQQFDIIWKQSKPIEPNEN